MPTWKELPNRIIRVEMTKRRIGYAELSERLTSIGVTENERSLRRKIARGAFSATFLLECLVALGVTKVDLATYDLPMAGDDD